MTESSSPKDTKKSQAELEAEIAVTRKELAATIDDLTTRLDPRVAASHAAHQAKQAAVDTGNLLSGGGLPDRDPARSRNVKVLIGAVVAGAALAVAAIVRRKS
ncbi:DUF3618 domain-containing protein [Oerskovia flava]|uniref:DUF3618 domain-containing protein n=1 Tax=Oerskovia flava TaxID=2986422 RepID=UPI00223F3C94|nr:DUF3618 domain-containing protein [Oerskovia sp. JB1-3-2]